MPRRVFLAKTDRESQKNSCLAKTGISCQDGYFLPRWIERAKKIHFLPRWVFLAKSGRVRVQKRTFSEFDRIFLAVIGYFLPRRIEEQNKQKIYIFLKKWNYFKLVPTCSYCPIPHPKAKNMCFWNQLESDRANPCNFLTGHVIIICKWDFGPRQCPRHEILKKFKNGMSITFFPIFGPWLTWLSKK